MDDQTARLVTKPERVRRKVMLAARDLGLTDEERHEFASYLLRRDVTTWKGLDEDQLLRLLDAMEGHHLIEQLYAMREPL